MEPSPVRRLADKLPKFGALTRLQKTAAWTMLN
jgi:hypothetical protein